MSQGEAAWQNDAENLVFLSRASNDSSMLSAYIGSLKKVSNKLTKLSWIFRAEFHAQRMRMSRVPLNHNQLDVLTTWLIGTAKYIPTRKDVAIRFARIALSEVHDSHSVLPHQYALAFMTFARALAVGEISDSDQVTIGEFIQRALALVEQIKTECNQPQGLRQLVRIYKSAAELEIRLSQLPTSYTDFTDTLHLYRASVYLNLGLELAEGEANTESQASQIRALLKTPAMKAPREVIPSEQ